MHIHGCKQTPPTPPTTSDEDSSGSTDNDEIKKAKGNRAMGKKKYPKAVKYYSKAIKIDPKNSTYRLNRCIANAALELWKDAEVDASKAVELGKPPSAKSYFQLARARLRRGRCTEAKETITSALKEFPDEKAFKQLRIEIDRELKSREEKRRKAAEAETKRPPVTAGPSEIQPLLDRARSTYELGNVDQALTLLDEARAAADAAAATGTDTRRQVASISSLRGKALGRQRRWEAAAAAFGEVVRIEEEVFSMDKPEEREAMSSAYNNLGIAHKNSGQLSMAVEAMNKAYDTVARGNDLTATTQAAQILENIGQCLRAQKKSGEATQFYSRSLEISARLRRPDHSAIALTRLGLARCLRDEGMVKEAMESYSKALEIWIPKDIEVCLQETPEVPNKERLSQIQMQCKTELGLLVAGVEKMQREFGSSLPGQTASVSNVAGDSGTQQEDKAVMEEATGEDDKSSAARGSGSVSSSSK